MFGTETVKERLKSFGYEVKADDGTPAIMPISDYTPTDEYLKCGGEKWEEE